MSAAASALLAAASASCVPSRLVLGSGSGSRAAILRELGLPFTVSKPGIDEKAIRFADPHQLVLALGKAKAEALLAKPEAAAWAAERTLLLTGDQVVVCGGDILEKPESEAEARRFIAAFARTPPSTVGSCVVTDARSGRQWAAVDVATVTFAPLPTATVDALVAEGEIFQCAGGLMVENPLVQPHILGMQGEMDAVMGLRKQTVLRLLAEAANAARADDAAGEPT